jgi:hypothetical protein
MSKQQKRIHRRSEDETAECVRKVYEGFLLPCEQRIDRYQQLAVKAYTLKKSVRPTCDEKSKNVFSLMICG